jgi:hypothetical protein
MLRCTTRSLFGKRHPIIRTNNSVSKLPSTKKQHLQKRFSIQTWVTLSPSPLLLNLASSKRFYSPMDYRIERDTFGEIRVPANKYWGAQTQR